MAGKNTSKSEHESRVGNILDDVPISEKIRSRLSQSLGKQIDKQVEYELVKLISSYKEIHRLSTSSNITSQDIKRTLIAMSKLTESMALKAYDNCDIHTEAFIERETYLMMKMGEAPSINIAISRSILHLEDLLKLGGRPNKKYIVAFITECLHLWKKYSIKPITSYFDDKTRLTKEYASGYDHPGKPSDTVEWCSLLLEQVIGYGYDSKEIVKIISENKGKV